ncbi:SDH family Clp fold serine proteinase [Pyxidicoccus caerfyrddinensis]|uniref:SDH family Clp fold serine proteinase n=1 Tax=Pyxidicoccus caerfyrddinensis TaxID=2709663 RepID=UPI0013DB89A7|nr:hypothetical protein [Pyxidicoccus caerfyrddinensis]
MNIRRHIEELEARRDSRVLVLAASHLELELLPELYDALRGLGRPARLDVVFYCRGGVVNAARRIALLLHEFTDHLAFIVPHRCESAGTITALAAREIVAGPVAVFSPIDPLLQTAPSSQGEGPLAISSQDVRLFSQMAREWFGLEEGEAKKQAMSVLFENIFPTTLTSFYRSILEARAICAELLSLHLADAPEAQRTHIADQLLFGHHSHTYALTRDNMAALGLPIRRDAPTEDLAWELTRGVRGTLGGGVRRSVEDDWVDAIFATREGVRRRRRGQGGLEPKWEAGELE